MRWIIIYLNKKLFLSYQELKTCKKELLETADSNQSGKRNPDNIIDPQNKC